MVVAGRVAADGAVEAALHVESAVGSARDADAAAPAAGRAGAAGVAAARSGDAPAGAPGRLPPGPTCTGVGAVGGVAPSAPPDVGPVDRPLPVGAAMTGVWVTPVPVPPDWIGVPVTWPGRAGVVTCTPEPWPVWPLVMRISMVAMRGPSAAETVGSCGVW